MNIRKIVEKKLKYLNELISIYSVSSYEENIIFYLEKFYKKLGYTVIKDVAGNLMAFNCKNPKTALISHVDTVGFMIGEKLSDKYYSLNTIGGPDFENLSSVVCFSEGKNVAGIIYKDKSDSSKSFFEQYSDFDIELEPGDLVSYISETKIFDDIIISPFLDDKSSVFISMILAEILKNQENDFIFCHTVREEFGGAGSLALPKNFPQSVENAVILDIVYGDSPLYKAQPIVGNGVGICFKDSTSGDRKLIRNLINTAKKYKIDYQIEIVTGGGSDLRNVIWQNGGIFTGYVGIPVKNCHSPKESASLNDICCAISLLYKIRKGKIR